jgi:hypothetical protein
MIFLDENKWEALRAARIHARQIGFELASKGIDDIEQIVPLLRRLQRPTFFTRDFGFYRPRFCDPRYCIVCVAVRRRELAVLIRAFLRFRGYQTFRERSGKVVFATRETLRVLQARAPESVVNWKV